MAKASDWAKRVAAWRASGLTATEFAASEGYRSGTLLWWSSELKRRERRGSSVGKAVGERSFVRMARVVPRAAEGTKLTLRVGSAEVEVRRGFDAGLLKEVVAALGGGA